MKRIIFMLVLLWMGAMSALNVCAEEEVLFFDDFDEYTWTASPTVTASDSWVTFDTLSGKTITVEKNFEKDASNIGEITIEYKLRFEDGAENIANTYSMPTIAGKSQAADKETIYIGGITSKRFLFYHKTGNIAKYAIKPNMDYIIKAIINYHKDSFEVAIYEEGNDEPVQIHKDMKPREIKDLSSLKLGKITMSIPKNVVIKMDYMKISSTGLNLKSIAPDMSKMIRTDSSISLEFSHELQEDTLNAIKVIDKNGKEVLSEVKLDKDDKKKCEIYFKGGLEYDASYTLQISDGLMSVDGKEFGGLEKTFNTEKSPFFVNSVLYYNENNEKISSDSLMGVKVLTNSVFISNSAGNEKTVTVLNLIYGEDDKLLRLYNSGITAENADKEYTIDMDLSDISQASYVKTYIWDSLEGMIKEKV